MRKKYVTLGLMLALWVAGAAWARQPANGIVVTGRLVSVEATGRAFTIATPAGSLLFETDGRTILTRRDERVALSDLRVRDGIRVTYSAPGRARVARLVDAVAVPSDDFRVGATGTAPRLQFASDTPPSDAMTVLTSGLADDDGDLSAGGRRTPGDIGSRRLLGLWGLAMIGVVLVLRARRPLTI